MGEPEAGSFLTAHPQPRSCPWPPAPLPQPARPSVAGEVITEVYNGMWRVHSAFDRHLRTFLSLLPAARGHLDLRFFLARFDYADSSAGAEHGGRGGGM